MRIIRRFVLILLVIAIELVIVAGQQHAADTAPLPTLMTLPSVTPVTPTATFAPSVTPTATATFTPSNTPAPTITPTLSERLLSVYVVNSGVATQTPAPTHDTRWTYLAQVPAVGEILPDATHTAPPYMGWYRFESDHPNVSYAPQWQPRLLVAASQGQYHRTESVGQAQIRMQGDAFRVRYVVAKNMGTFQVAVDGQIIDTIDAHAPELGFRYTPVYMINKSARTVTLHARGETVGFDAIDIFRAPDHVRLDSPPTPPAVPTAHMIKNIKLIQQPETDDLPQRVRVVIAYDENANRAVDPSEGVQNVPIFQVDAVTNQIIATRFTDPRGVAEFVLTAGQPARIVAPYFDQVWSVGRGDQDLLLLIEPGNQPGVLP